MVVTNSASTVPAQPAPGHTVQIIEVSAANLPTQDDYKYRCRLSVSSGEGLQLQKDLMVRLQPTWLLNIQHPGDCAIALTLLYRQGGLGEPWQEAGTVEFSTAGMFERDRSIEVEQAVTTWAAAPDLTLKTRLAQSSSTTATSTVSLNLVPQSVRARRRPPLSDAVATDDIPAAIPLSRAEAVVVKDVWNKLRAWKELQMEVFFKRLLVEAPELEYVFGAAIDSMPDYFFELLDCCVRQLCPHTETVVWEPMMGVPPEKGDVFDTVEEYGALFADIGLQLQHWLQARQVWMWMLPQIPYLEDYDRENLTQGVDSALYKFFNTHVIANMMAARDRYDAALSPAVVQRMADSWEPISRRKNELGIEFYQTLFERYPEVLPIFGRANMDYLATHLLQSLEFLFTCLAGGSTERLLDELRHLGRLHSNAGVPSFAYPAIGEVMITLFERHVPDFDDSLRQAWLTLIDRVSNVIKLPKLNEERLLKKAREFLQVIADEQAWEETDREQRWQEIQAEVQATGTYTHTYEELAYGAQLSWRNASKCIGRIQWQNLVVRDRRHVSEPDAMFRELEEHLRLATNNGNIQITMTVFRPRLPRERWGPRLWNPQLIRYAAYEMPDGSILGDAANLGVTQAIVEKMGWQPPEPRTAYDILPLVIEVPGQAPRLYEFQAEDILEVELEHPTIPEFKNLGMRWYAVPAVSNFRMDIGGISYGCIPFNGWYMGSEIARDFLEDWRYDQMAEIAALLGLKTHNEATLWRDRVALEMNVAVIHSFQKAKVTLVDHQSAAQQFLAHDQREKKAGRECPADYGWVVPPAGGSACPVWHHQMRDFYLEPAYHHAADRWAVEADVDLEQFVRTAEADSQGRDRILILYGSETGTAEGFARRAARQLAQFNPQVMALDEYNLAQLATEKLLLIVTSTFGNGEMPGNGQQFLQGLQQQLAEALTGVNYAVLGIGSTVYEHFCAAGMTLHKLLARKGANPLVPLHKADAVKGQAATFQEWLGLVSRLIGVDETSAQAQALPRLQITYLSDAAIALPTLVGTAVPLLANQELLKAVVPGSRSTRYLLFDISDTTLAYETGDHVRVYPHNSAALVQRLCDRLNLVPDAAFTAQYVLPNGQIADTPPPIAGPTTVRQAFTEMLDLVLQAPFIELLTALQSAATAVEESIRLATWLEVLALPPNHADSAALRQTLTDNFMTVVDLLEAFPSAQIGLDVLLEHLPRLKPRLYSISSCPQFQPGRLQITVGVLQVQTDAGKTRPGVCSNYLAGLQPGDTVRIDPHSSDFCPPADPTAPLLMVGPGTGLSPLLAFLQHREYLQRQGAALGNATLYFGCRDHNDFLYETQLKAWLASGVLTDLQVAFSRLNESKVYVQTLIRQRAAEVWQQLSHPQCHYYVCGDARMADNVFDTFVQIAKTEGGLSHLDAIAFFDQMKQEGRFATDVWGVTLNFNTAIKQVEQDNYRRAEKWLTTL